MQPGISAISIYVPRHRVDLERWCEWTGANWAKVSSVIGHGFRVCGPDEDAYSMAANAVLRLIRQNRVDPRRVGMLALGTESSTDNAAGAVIVRGMVDGALARLGLPTLARDCEVPEFKHACLGGVYATKAATRYVSCDGRDRLAIVVSSDIAEYERGSSGEGTQGAGAVAFLVEAEAKLLALDLAHSGSASRDRSFDFRKPFARHFAPGYRGEGDGVRDYPVFNGKYSTLCYVDAVVAALDQMFERLGTDRQRYYAELGAVVLHRPYHQLPIAAIATALAIDLARDPAGRGQLGELALAAEVEVEAVLQEVEAQAHAGFDLLALALEHGPEHDPLRAVTAVAKQLRGSSMFAEFQAAKLSLGAERVRELGNLYTASLPAWLAAAFEQAVAQGIELEGRSLLLVGYGSGDAAEAIPATVVSGWQRAASRIGLGEALEHARELERAQYEAIHDGRSAAGVAPVDDGFAIREVGDRNAGTIRDIGIAYYEYRQANGART